MNSENEWDVARPSRGWLAGGAGAGILRITLLFGSAAVALALILAPIAESQSDGYVAQSAFGDGVDRTVTGSIGKGSYTVRRSVLQASPDSVCVIRANGTRSGDC
jgi:hypothetical protein